MLTLQNYLLREDSECPYVFSMVWIRNVSSNGWKKTYMLLQGRKLYTTKKVSVLPREDHGSSFSIIISHLIRGSWTATRARTHRRGTLFAGAVLSLPDSEYELWALNVPRRKSYSALLAARFKRAHYLPYCDCGPDVLKCGKTSLRKRKYCFSMLISERIFSLGWLIR